MNNQKNLHQLTPEELGKLFPIIISEPNPKWPEMFQSEKLLIENLLEKEIVIRIEHIGSTAVPNLKSKPTIDILFEVSQDNFKEDAFIKKFQEIGYHYINRPENPEPHMMFVKGYTEKGFNGQAFHVHVRFEGDWDETYFRDYLLKNPNVANEYAKLKSELAEKFKNDRDGYTDAKTEFIKRIMVLAKPNYDS